MDLQMSNLVILVTERPWYMVYATRRNIYWGLAHNVVFCWYSDLISHTHTHTHTHKNTQHTQTNRLTHPYKYILTPSAMCSQQLSVLHWIIPSKIYFSMSFLFKKYSLVEVVYLFIRCHKTKFFLWKTNNTDKNGVNKQNRHTHTKYLQKDNTEKGSGVPHVGLSTSEFLFLTAQKKQVMTSSLFELEIYQ